MIVQIRRGLPAGPFAWTSQSRSPSAPPAFSRDPAQIALGQALAARVTEATRITAEDAASVGLFEFASGRFAKPIHDLHNLATRAIARFLVTGQGTTETERNFIGRVGVMAAVFGLSVATLTRSYLLWRDSNLRVLNEEVKRLGTSLRCTTRHGGSSGPVRKRASHAWFWRTKIRWTSSATARTPQTPSEATSASTTPQVA